ncbi:MAG: alpha/beta hydrolase [Acidobacteria bacterium]|nr:alpha/beta hydrolase [Acidobacteriota bacterium]
MKQLVLIPGLLCDRRLWCGQIAVLERRCEIIVPDITRQRSVTEMAAAVINQVGGHFSLAGFSLGGHVALEIARLAPERVERLALLSTTHGGLTPAVTAAISNAVAMLEGGEFDRYLEEVYPFYFAPTHIADPVQWNAFTAMAHAVGPQAGIRQMQALLAMDGPFPHLGRISCPAMVIAGQEDQRATPAVQRLLAEEIPRCELAMIADSGHFTPMEQPAKVTQILAGWLPA